MITEKRLLAVSPQIFTSNGTSAGVVAIADASLFKVKQIVLINGTALATLELEVKRVISTTQLAVGPKGGSIDSRQDLTLYTTIALSNIKANEQLRPNVPEQSVERFTYEEEPTVARRVVLVDKLGNKIDSANPLPVDATLDVGDIDVNVHLTDEDNNPNPGDVADKVRIGDGTDELDINSDGSINVVVVDGPNGDVISEFNSVSSVASAVNTTILTYVVPVGKTLKLTRVDVSGTNIARYEVLIDATVEAQKRTWFNGSLNETFDFSSPSAIGYSVAASSTIQVKVLHARSLVGDFESRLQGVLVD